MIALARLVDTHGTQGEIKARSFSGEIEHLLGLPSGEVRRSGEVYAVSIESARPNKKELLLRFEGVHSIEEARKYVGGELWGSSEYAVPRGADEYYVRDLIGMTVLDGDRSIGTITAVFDGPQAPLLEIRRETGAVLVPFMNEFVGTIDEGNGTLEIVQPWVMDSE